MRKVKKQERRLPRSPALRIATIAVLTAVTIVLTIVVKIPIPLTRGYFNLSDMAIYFAAFTFGPITAMLAGGIGTFIADAFAGVFIPYSPISLFVHGLQGFLVWLISTTTLIGKEKQRGWPINPFWIIAAAIGTFVMCAGYFVAQLVLFGIGPAVVELPFNLLQNVAGLLAGIPLSLAVRKAYPPVAELRW